jgi:hypothetical protein
MEGAGSRPVESNAITVAGLTALLADYLLSISFGASRNPRYVCVSALGP